MITGFNTDVEYEGVIYHVQTEDKGAETPLILSLVYNRGTILASKRSPYEDLLREQLDEKILAERLQKQHKLICAAIRGGRLEDLKRMTMKDSAARKNALAANKQIPVQSVAVIENKPADEMSFFAEKAVPSAIVAPRESNDRITQKIAEKIDRAKANLPQAAAYAEPPKTENQAQSAPVAATLPIPKPPTITFQTAPQNIAAEPIIEAHEIYEQEVFLPAEAVVVVDDFSSNGAFSDKLEIGFLNETEFRGGDRKTVSIIVRRGQSQIAVADAQVMVKILGSSFRPMIFHAKTDTNGVAIVHLQLPHFRSGRAAILARALVSGEETEMRRIITHG